MATGDQMDMAARIRSVLPRGWFPDTAPGAVSATPVLDGILAGLGNAWAWVYSFTQYAHQQMRVQTATGTFLDMSAQDYFGPDGLLRKASEGDAAYSTRIQANLLREKATRAGLISAVTSLTGRAPVVFEPRDPRDCGGYGMGTLGYGTAGGYGSLGLPFQCFVTAFRPNIGGIVGLQGYYSPTGGTDLNPASASLAGMASGLTNSMIVGTHDVPPLRAGFNVAKHIRGTGSDTNVGFGGINVPIVAGGVYCFSLWLWVPSAHGSAAIDIQVEAAGWTTNPTAADMTKHDQWQRVYLLTAPSAGALSAVNFVLRDAGAAGDVFYSTDWEACLLPPASGGYGQGPMGYANLADEQGNVTDADIMATIVATAPEAVIPWTRIRS
jgi:hypothetical protein